MGRTPNYRGDRARMRAWAEVERRVTNKENVIVRPGGGKYPECLTSRPYGWCPKPEDVPADPKDVRRTCRFCEEYLHSKFYEQHFAAKARREKLRQLQEAGIPTKIVSRPS